MRRYVGRALLDWVGVGLFARAAGLHARSWHVMRLAWAN
jgi:hypothetical protein